MRGGAAPVLPCVTTPIDRIDSRSMPISHLTRIVEFTAGHRVRRADWTAAQNAQAFGKAATEHEHGYRVSVTVRGPLAADQKGVVNLTELDGGLREEITARLDGKLIHAPIPAFADGKPLAPAATLSLDCY